jgi:N-carbamoyl-L-amino-acid hydrolase
MPLINSERLLSDLRHLRTIGAVGQGVVRPAFSAADMAARDWLRSQFEEAGLTTAMDGVGNVTGKSPNTGPAMLIGSHSDTQPTGGWLDGALGVIYGLEVARTLAEDSTTRHLAVDVVSLQDEESRFYGCLGSRSLCGLLPPDAISQAMDKDGVTLPDALREAGLENVPHEALDLSRYRGFLEAHIEQGPHLEAAGNRVGVVDSIVGLGGRRFRFIGEQNHAGTTMMSIRKDAATALFALAQGINDAFSALAGPRSVWTMGRVEVRPGAASIVPGYAELELQYRDPSMAMLDAFEAEVDRLVNEVRSRDQATVEMSPSRERIAPVMMDETLRVHLGSSAQKHAPGQWVEMPSGAYHDAGVMAALLPTAMLFIPSIGGVSHDFSENSHDEDIVMGCQVLADATAAMLLDT